MKPTNIADAPDKAFCKTEYLMEVYSCGRRMANQIGNAARAKVVIGNRVLWNLKKIQEYMDSVSGPSEEGETC